LEFKTDHVVIDTDRHSTVIEKKHFDDETGKQLDSDIIELTPEEWNWVKKVAKSS
jgi:hypothetical protein